MKRVFLLLVLGSLVGFAFVVGYRTYTQSRDLKLSYINCSNDRWGTVFSVETKFSGVFTGDSDSVETRKLTVEYKSVCKDSKNSRQIIEYFVDETQNPYYNKPIGPFKGQLAINENGLKPEISSTLKDDDYQGTFIKEYRFLFPPLPQGVVEVGKKWQWSSVLHLPDDEHLGIESPLSFRSMDIYGVSKILEISEDGLVQISVAITNTPFDGGLGESLGLDLAGQMTFDSSKGRFIKGFVKGDVGMTLLIIQLSMDIALVFNEVPVKSWLFDDKSKTSPLTIEDVNKIK